MAKAIAGFFHVCLALICGMSLFPRQADAEELRYGRLNPFCPFTCNFEEDGRHGLVIDIFMAVTAMNGMTYRDVEVPSKRKFTALDADISNVTTVWSTNKKALASVISAEEAIVAVRWGTATRNDLDFTFRTLEDLKDLVLIVSATTDFSQEFEEFLQAGEKSGRVILLYGENVARRGLNLLTRGRGDVYLTGMVPLGHRIKNWGYMGKFNVAHAPYFPTAYVYPSFSKNNPKAQDYADMMTDGIRDLRKTGRLAEILAAYGLTDWAGEN
jgi:polar amino acid transport system substrate-binding protein